MGGRTVRKDITVLDCHEPKETIIMPVKFLDGINFPLQVLVLGHGCLLHSIRKQSTQGDHTSFILVTQGLDGFGHSHVL